MLKLVVRITLLLWLGLLAFSSNAETNRCGENLEQYHPLIQRNPRAQRNDGLIQLRIIVPTEIAGKEYQHLFLISGTFRAPLRDRASEDVVHSMVMGLESELSQYQLSAQYGQGRCRMHLTVPLLEGYAATTTQGSERDTTSTAK